MPTRRLTLLLVLALCACEDDSALEDRSQPHSAAPVRTTGTIVFIGDSITQEWPLSQYLEGAVNAGVSGNETPQMLARFQRDVLAHRPVLVVIHGGINDIRNRKSTDCSSLLQMAQMAKAANVKVVMGTVLYAESLGPDRREKKKLIRRMNAEISAAAASQGHELVNYYPLGLTWTGAVDLRKLPDGLHPGPEGYEAMWNALLPLLRSQGVVRDPSGG